MKKYVHKDSNVLGKTIYEDVKPLNVGLVNYTVNDIQENVPRGKINFVDAVTIKKYLTVRQT